MQTAGKYMMKSKADIALDGVLKGIKND